MIVFVGLAPSSRNEDPHRPFQGTKSGERLNRWIKSAEVRSYSLCNLFHHVLVNQPSVEDLRRAALNIKDYCRYSDLVVALGVDVSRALKAAGIEHYRMPHPSGRNRLFNTKGYEEMIVLKLKHQVASASDAHEFI